MPSLALQFMGVVNTVRLGNELIVHISVGFRPVLFYSLRILPREVPP